ncbi:MAG: N-acyl homoserine lactonase family protein [Alphaproteobacteria bacterium]|nr:N-acyl homoserine lactonase family protein [Alphaproteobacteria bacterium]
MQRVPLLAGLCAAILIGQSALAPTPAPAQAPEITLTRIECGTPQAPTAVNQRFSDTYSYGDLKVQFVYSCYLIKHGNDYMLWDTGHSMSAPNVAPKVSIVDQLAQLKVTPDQIKFVGISHYHADHTGQVASFPKSTLLIGTGDWDVLNNPKPLQGANVAPFEHWMKGGGKVEPVPQDKDVFGDGSVMMLYLPGHTPGHHGLMVKLPQMGVVVLSGDLVHFQENWNTDGVPAFNIDRAQSVASIERVKKIVAAHKATLIIQHDQRDIAKLPAFPAAAK